MFNLANFEPSHPHLAACLRIVGSEFAKEIQIVRLNVYMAWNMLLGFRDYQLNASHYAHAHSSALRVNSFTAVRKVYVDDPVAGVNKSDYRGLEEALRHWFNNPDVVLVLRPRRTRVSLA